LVPNYKKNPGEVFFPAHSGIRMNQKIAVLMIDTPTDGRKEVPEKWRGLRKTFLF